MKKETLKKSMVNHPSHYNSGNIECIDGMIAAFGAEETMVFCKINAFKYLWRAQHKNGLEDMEKAKWYLDKYLELDKTLKKEPILEPYCQVTETKSFSKVVLDTQFTTDMLCDIEDVCCSPEPEIGNLKATHNPTKIIFAGNEQKKLDKQN